MANRGYNDEWVTNITRICRKTKTCFYYSFQARGDIWKESSRRHRHRCGVFLFLSSLNISLYWIKLRKFLSISSVKRARKRSEVCKRVRPDHPQVRQHPSIRHCGINNIFHSVKYFINKWTCFLGSIASTTRKIQIGKFFTC